MADHSENGDSRADHDEKELFAAIGNKVLGLKVGDENKLEEDEGEDENVKVIDEIESYCVNCEENVFTHGGIQVRGKLTL